jgi:tetratricopeptide (TPR) repeat protein
MGGGVPKPGSHPTRVWGARPGRLFWLIICILWWQAPGLAAEVAACNPDLLNNYPEVRQCYEQYEKLLSKAGRERTQILSRLSRLAFMLGELSDQEEKKQFFEKGKVSAELLIQEQPDLVDGHYWLALNLCGSAENSAVLEAYRLLPRILQELDQAVKIDPTYDQGGSHRVLGRIFFEAPGWPISVGDLNKALRHLEAAVRFAPKNSTNQLFLGEAYLKAGDREMARQHLEKVLHATQHSLLPLNIANDRYKAEHLLAKYSAAD